MLRRIFVGPNGIRAGWRLLIYLIFAAVILGVLFHLALHTSPSRVPEFRLGKLLPGELIAAFATLAAAAIMARIEHRPFGSYGLPWKRALGARFCEGAVWGFTAMTVILLILRATNSFSFGSAQLHSRQMLFYAVAWGGFFLVVGLYEEFSFPTFRHFFSRASCKSGGEPLRRAPSFRHRSSSVSVPEKNRQSLVRYWTARGLGLGRDLLLRRPKQRISRAWALSESDVPRTEVAHWGDGGTRRKCGDSVGRVSHDLACGPTLPCSP